MKTLRDWMEASPYHEYAYAYPHKTAYRTLDPAIPLQDVWRKEPKNSLFLYLHIPFCEMRCGFCNLFTQSHGHSGLKQTLEANYLDALERHAHAFQRQVPSCSFTRMAVGGGTPTFLSQGGLERLMRIAQNLGANPAKVPCSVEASPFTAQSDRLSLLVESGVTRLSIGVQSFHDHENAASGRAQKRTEVENALRRIRRAGFPILNIDLIYGLPGQTQKSWLESLDAALAWGPEELYLYPLYVRPLTGLGKRSVHDARDRAWNDLRLACYRAARDRLLSHGYEHISMRMFRRANLLASEGPAYCCQEDGMVGLGCGARSYTRSLHYSTEYAVGADGVGAILAHYLGRSEPDFAHIQYGCTLNTREQRRRYLLKSLLRREGLDTVRYLEVFGTDACEDFSSLQELLLEGVAAWDGASLKPTERGLEYADAIAPWLVSTEVRERMNSFVLR